MVVILTGDPVLMDMEALVQWTRRAKGTIRKHCVPIRYEPDRRALYDARACADLLLNVPQRRACPR